MYKYNIIWRILTFVNGKYKKKKNPKKTQLIAESSVNKYYNDIKKYIIDLIKGLRLLAIIIYVLLCKMHDGNKSKNEFITEEKKDGEIEN